MKTKLYICCALFLLATTGGCNHKFDEYNTNPNQMDMWKIGPESMLEEVVYSGADGFLYRTRLLNGELIQYTASGGLTQAYHRYALDNSVMSSAWTHLFAWAANADHMAQLAERKENRNCRAIALTMKALFLSNATDIFGDVPCSEAFKGRDGLTKPVFDTQRSVYEQIFTDLELANTLYDESLKLQMPSRDLLYGGDIKKWRRFTNSLHLRLLMRLSNRDREMGVSEKIKTIVADPVAYPVFTANSDNATIFYSGQTPFINRFGNENETNFTANGNKPAEQMIGMLAEPGDPRISIWFVQKGNAWKGMVSGMPTQETDASGVAWLNKQVLGEYTSPYSLMKYDELLFIFAEAAQRGWIDGGREAAGKYYEQGVRASVRFWADNDPAEKPVPDAMIDDFLRKIPYDGTMQLIAEQKYVALFWTGYEAWHEYRRTGYPELKIGSGTLNDHILPTRFAYPTNTAESNPDNYAQAVIRMGGADNMKTPVWWSKQAAEGR